MNKLKIVLVLDDIRSIHNVGALMRTADAMGVNKIITCGTTAHPRQPDDTRLPHVIKRAEAQLSKTALGAEATVECLHVENINEALEVLRGDGYQLIAIELAQTAKELSTLTYTHPKIALVLGNEIDGISKETLESVDKVYQIAMLGKKESLNVSSVGAIALYQLRHISTASTR